MAMGVSSYTGRGVRGRRRIIRQGPPPPLQVMLGRSRDNLTELWPLLKLPLTLLAVAHLVLVALFPGARNALLGTTPQDVPDYLTMLQVGDALGFSATHGRDGFLVYKIYTQNGDVVSGTFPDDAVAPRLRYDRWAVAGDAAAGPHAELHAFVARYVLERLPSPPVRMELFAARWRWDRNSLTFPWPGKGPQTALELKLLGNYNGLTRVWEPIADKGRAQ